MGPRGVAAHDPSSTVLASIVTVLLLPACGYIDGKTLDVCLDSRGPFIDAF
jgi:hypothetical protein